MFKIFYWVMLASTVLLALAKVGLDLSMTWVHVCIPLFIMVGVVICAMLVIVGVAVCVEALKQRADRQMKDKMDDLTREQFSEHLDEHEGNG
jgi:hypothetical protein